MKPLSIVQRASLFNNAFPHLQPLAVGHLAGRPFVHGYWHVGGGNISGFYGSYQTEYLARITSMFPDCKGQHEVMHLFSGSMPPSSDYTRVGVDPTGQYKSDIEIDAHKLSSFLRFRPKLTFADPPYSEEDSEHYKNSMVNRERIIQEIALVTDKGSWLVWLDQALPVHSSDSFAQVGGISYVRSTGNRFRLISIFQRI